MPNQYASPPPGKIWVPTPNGLVAMTVEEARAYKARTTPSGGISLANLDSPDISADLRQKLKDPRVLAALQRGQSTTVQVGGTKFQISNGQVTHFTSGSVWKPILAAGAVAATGGIAGAYLGGGAGAAGATGAGTAGTTGAVGTAGAGGLLPATTLPTATGTVAGLAPSGAVAASSTPSVSSWLSGTGQFLGTPGGATLAGVAGNLIGAGIQSSANTHAAEIAAQTAREALGYEKQRDTYAQQLEASRYADLNSRLTPYISSGQNASARMAQILGLPAPETAPMGQAPTPMGSGPAPTYQTRVGLDTTQQPVGTAIPRPGGTLMRAPDGSVQQVPPEHVAHYTALGAQVVG